MAARPRQSCRAWRRCPTPCSLSWSSSRSGAAYDSWPALWNRHCPNGCSRREDLSDAGLLVTDVHIRDLAWALITPTNAEDHVRLWGGVVARCRRRWPPPLCLLGMAAWVSGAGALLNCCCERLAQVDPHYSMGRLLADISERALPRPCGNRLEVRCKPSCVLSLGCSPGSKLSSVTSTSPPGRPENH